MFDFFYFLDRAESSMLVQPPNPLEKRAVKLVIQAEREQVVLRRNGAAEEANRKNDTGEEHRSLYRW